jgi:hypothetical protein
MSAASPPTSTTKNSLYAKFQVYSRIELVLKLGNTAGELEFEKRGLSIVEASRKTLENRDRLNSWLGWAIPFRDTISMINEELEMRNFLSLNHLLVLVASLLLLFVNWLAFHDFHEAHTVRDWLMLIASVLVFFKFASEFWNQYFRHV